MIKGVGSTIRCILFIYKKGIAIKYKKKADYIH
jgi:hypothetical protein